MTCIEVMVIIFYSVYTHNEQWYRWWKLYRCNKTPI